MANAKNSSTRSEAPAAHTMPRQMIEDVAGVFSVMSDPTRLRILQLLKQGPLCVGDIVTALDLKQANVSKQLGILHERHLVDRRREGTQAIYFICEPMIFEMCHLVCGKIERDVQERLERIQRDQS